MGLFWKGGIVGKQTYTVQGTSLRHHRNSQVFDMNQIANMFQREKEKERESETGFGEREKR